MNRAEIRSLAEVMSDMDSSSFPTITQKNTIIDDEVRSLFVELVNANFPAKRLVTSVTASGVGSYPLSVSRLLRVVAVRDLRLSAYGSSGTVKRANNLDRNNSTTLAIPVYFSLPTEVKYDIEVDPSSGPSLLLFPPGVTGNFSVECIQGHPGLATDSTELYLPDPAAKVVALASARRFLRKEDQMAGAALSEELNEERLKLWQAVSSLLTPASMEDYVSLEEARCFDVR